MSEVTCRGCGKEITPAGFGGYWTDKAFLVVCVKARLEDIGHGQRPDYVLHAPMPPGLRGGPEGKEEGNEEEVNPGS